jgi:hypothetical protein
MNAAICRRPEKNHLYLPKASEPQPLLLQDIDECDKKYKDLLAEYQRIISGEKRRGFVVFGSGGNSTISGSHAPSAGAVTGSSTGFFEHSQRMNKRNISLSEAAAEERMVVVCISGPYFPKRMYCPLLTEQLGEDTEQLAYLGPYFVRDLGCRYDIRDKAAIERIVNHHKLRFDSSFDTKLLRGSTRNRRAYVFIPWKIPHEWFAPGFQLRYVIVSPHDPRRLKYDIPSNVEFSRAMDSVGDNTIFYQDAVDRFFKNEDYRLFFKPWVPREDCLNKVRGKKVDWETDAAIDETLLEWTKSIDPGGRWDQLVEQHDDSDAEVNETTGVFQRRRTNLPKIQSLMLKCSVACFARTLKMNVDLKKKNNWSVSGPF